MNLRQILPTGSLLLLTLILTPFLFNFHPEQYSIPPEVKSLLDRAEINRCKFNFDSTVILLQEAQALYRKMNKEKEALALYGRILYIYPETEMATEKNNAKLIAEAQAVLDKSTIDHKEEIQTLIELGRLRYTVIHELGLEKVQALADKLIAQSDPEKDWDLLAAVYAEINFAYTLSRRSDVADKVEESAKKGIEIIEKHLKKHHKEKAHLYYYYPYYLYYTYSNVSDFYYENKDYENTLKYEKKTINDVLANQIFFDSLLFSTTYNSIAYIYSEKGDHQKAAEYFRYAISYTAERFPHAFAIYYAHLGESLQEAGKHQEAIECFLKALHFNELNTEDLEEKEEDKAYAYRQLLLSFSYTEQFDKAKEVLEKLKQLSVEKDYVQSRIYAAMGVYYKAIKDYPQAIEYFGKAIKKFSPKSIYNGFCYWNLGQIEMEKNNYKAALAFFQKSISFATKDFEESDFSIHPKFDQIIDKNTIINYLIDKLQAMRLLAQSSGQLSNCRQSIEDLTTLTVDIFESVRNSFERDGSKRSLLEAAFSTYESAIAVHLDLYNENKDPRHLQTAFSLSERSKSVLLMDALKESNALGFAGIPDSLVKREKELTNNVAFYKQRVFLTERKDSEKAALYQKYLFEAEEELDAMKARFEKDFANYYQLKYQKTDLSVEAILKSLPKDAAMLEYFEGKEALFVFVLYNGEIKSYRIPQNDAYKSDSEGLYKALTDMAAIAENPVLALETFQNSSFNFYKNYVDTYLPKDARQLLLIPDGTLCYIPFEALLTEAATTGSSFEQLPYLLGKYNTSYHYSATLWLEQLKRPTTNISLEFLAMAASYETIKAKDEFSNDRVRSVRDGLMPIQGALDEVANLKAIFRGEFLSAADADEIGFKEKVSKYGIIHLAMHGVVDNKHPEYSGLVFTDNPKNKEDDLLHAYEIKSMKLNAELVVLSACETGYGKYQHGEGVASMGRGFMYAGAPSVVMTLWKLHDQSSVLLIESFYNYLSQGLPKDEALRLAKLDYLKINKGPAAHPALWAAFVQLGDNRPIRVGSIHKSNLLGWMLGAGGVLVLGFGAMALRRKNKT